MICSDSREGINITPPIIKPAKADADAGREFIEGIREGLEDYAAGRYKVFKDADELLDELLKDDISCFDPQ